MMRLVGPHEVFFNKREVYKLNLSNTGSGPAENIGLTLASLAGSESPPVSHRLGTLAAGEERTIDVELVARQAGNLTIHVEARGDGSAHAELAEKVIVHRPGLRIDLEGPATQFIGAVGQLQAARAESGRRPGQEHPCRADPAHRREVRLRKRRRPAVDRRRQGPVARRADRARRRAGAAAAAAPWPCPGPAALEVASTADDELTAVGRERDRGRGPGRLAVGSQGPRLPGPRRPRRGLRIAAAQPRHQDRRKRRDHGLLLQQRRAHRRRRPAASHQSGPGRSSAPSPALRRGQRSC